MHSQIVNPIRFYRAAGDEVTGDRSSIDGLTISRWLPSSDGKPTGVFRGLANTAWYTMNKMNLFPRRDLCVYAIHDGPKLLHRLLVTPRWYRFPFMQPGDLQIGMLWTAPEMRGRGLAKAAINAVHLDLRGRTNGFWYLVDEDNAPSIRLIEKFGYHLIGTGKRTRPLGVRAIGKFVINCSRGSRLPE